MPSCKCIYEPREDSTMLEIYVRQHAFGLVLDMGTGSGIHAIAAALSFKVEKVIAVDVQKEVIKYCRKNIPNPKISFIQSDLFSKISGKFDTIIFNPPYLPQETDALDLLTEGGKRGYETIERFLNAVNGYLKRDGKILLVFSSFTKKEKVEELCRKNLLEFTELERKHIFFEDLYACLLYKNDLNKNLLDLGISKIRYFSKGRRGLIFTGDYKKRKIAIKTRNPRSNAGDRIKIEADWLIRLNKSGIGPRILHSGKDFIVMEFIEGGNIIDFFSQSSKNEIIALTSKIVSQLKKLDELKIDKEEMHRPIKNLIIMDGKPFLIDFERANYSGKPKNLTQFFHFISSGNVAKIFKSKGIIIDKQEIISLSRKYKKMKGKPVIDIKKIIK